MNPPDPFNCATAVFVGRMAHNALLCGGPARLLLVTRSSRPVRTSLSWLLFYCDSFSVCNSTTAALSSTELKVTS
jgi:hypothetical protein